MEIAAGEVDLEADEGAIEVVEEGSQEVVAEVSFTSYTPPPWSRSSSNWGSTVAYSGLGRI